jgi:hypothetical protein
MRKRDLPPIVHVSHTDKLRRNRGEKATDGQKKEGEMNIKKNTYLRACSKSRSFKSDFKVDSSK